VHRAGQPVSAARIQAAGEHLPGYQYLRSMSPAMPRAFSLPPDLHQHTWKALVKELGIVDATRSVMAVEPGEGDSLEKYAKL
jgi:hypothetical protein